MFLSHSIAQQAQQGQVENEENEFVLYAVRKQATATALK